MDTRKWQKDFAIWIWKKPPEVEFSIEKHKKKEKTEKTSDIQKPQQSSEPIEFRSQVKTEKKTK